MALARFQQYIDGRFEDAADFFESVNPSNGAPWALMPAASAEDVDRAVSSAHRALWSSEWRNLTATQRGRLLYRLADLVSERSDYLAELETRDTGKIIRETKAQVGYVVDYYRYFAGLADKVGGIQIPIDKADMEVYLRREPIGVVAAIVPWNSQLFLSAVKLGPALAAGCTIVVKASEDGPAPLLAFAELVHQAGFPRGVVNIVTGFADPCGQALTSHPLISRIAFTGGPGTARHIVSNSANNLALTTLELGGKSPVLVFGDADLESTCNAVVAGIFGATGQSCVAGSRLLLDETICDGFLDRLIEKARSIRIGDPQDASTEVGPLATLKQREHIEAVLRRSIELGATVATGGAIPKSSGNGFFFEPTVVLNAGSGIPCNDEELFGPVLSVDTFSNEDEALSKANDSKFGLASGVFTKNLTLAHRAINRLHAGIVWVNTYRAVSPLVPFGGYGQSGLGREGGVDSILDYTRSKSVWIRTSDDSIPDPFVMR